MKLIRCNVDAASIHDYCPPHNNRGHAVDEHLVETKDGYRLGLHRILPSVTLTTSVPEGPRPVVLMVHGFLMNSEVFVCHPGGTDHNLALSLSEKG